MSSYEEAEKRYYELNSATNLTWEQFAQGINKTFDIVYEYRRIGVDKILLNSYKRGRFVFIRQLLMILLAIAGIIYCAIHYSNNYYFIALLTCYFSFDKAKDDVGNGYTPWLGIFLIGYCIYNSHITLQDPVIFFISSYILARLMALISVEYDKIAFIKELKESEYLYDSIKKLLIIKPYKSK